MKPMVRDKITDPWRETTWEEAIGRVASEFRRIQNAVRPHGRRRHHLVALHERGSLPRPEDHPRRLRREQRRHLRPRLPLADGLRPEDGVRRKLGHAGLRLRREHGRHPRHRRQPAGRASGVREPHEEAHPRGREADRGRSAPHGPREVAAHRRRTTICRCSPAPNVAIVTAMGHVIVTEGLVNEAVRARALRSRTSSTSGRSSSREERQLSRGDGEVHGRQAPS